MCSACPRVMDASLSSVKLDELAASLIHEQGDEMALRIDKELREDPAAAISSTKKRHEADSK